MLDRVGVEVIQDIIFLSIQDTHSICPLYLFVGADMALRSKVLQKKAEKFEAKELHNINLTSERISALGELLENAYLIRRPTSKDYDDRRSLVRVFNDIAKELYGPLAECPSVEEFGSFSMDLFSAGSDLDLSVNFGNAAIEFSREKRIRTLRKFAKKFYNLQRQGHVYGVQPIMTAKVPILKIIDRGTGIECDLSVENRDGILKSQIVRLISSIDERFHKLSCLMKAWAKAHKINSSKDHTLNSLSITLLVAFHLQTRNPPILPPFSAILKDGADLPSVKKLVHNFRKYGSSNTESLAELFVLMLLKLASIEKLWPKGLCASTYEGSWISKEWDSKVAVMSVEDFTDRSQNVARAVGKSQVEDIYKCIQLSIKHLSAFMSGHTEGPMLRDFLFGGANVIVAHSHVAVGPVEASQFVPAAGGQGRTQLAMTSNLNLSTSRRTQNVPDWERMPAPSIGVMPFDHCSPKRVRLTDVWGGSSTGNFGQASMQGSVGSWREPATQGWGGTPRDRWADPLTNRWGERQKVDWSHEPLIQKTRELQSTKDLWAGSWNGSSEANRVYEPSMLRHQELQSAQNSLGGKPAESWGVMQQGVNWSYEPPLARLQEIRSTNGWGQWHQLPSQATKEVIGPSHFPPYMLPEFDNFRR